MSTIYITNLNLDDDLITYKINDIKYDLEPLSEFFKKHEDALILIENYLKLFTNKLDSAND